MRASPQVFIVVMLCKLHRQAFALVSKEWAEVARKSTSRRQIRSGEVVSVLVKNVSHPLTDIDCSKATLVRNQLLCKANLLPNVDLLA